MGIINRAKDITDKHEGMPFAFANLSFSNGETGVLAYVPFPCNLRDANIATFSVVGSINLILTVNRFIVGAGFTSYTVGSTFALRSFGTSGVFASGLSLPAFGSTLLQLMPNDVIGYLVAGGSTASCSGIAGNIILTKTQDVTRYFGGVT